MDLCVLSVWLEDVSVCVVSVVTGCINVCSQCVWRMY